MISPVEDGSCRPGKQRAVYHFLASWASTTHGYQPKELHDFSEKFIEFPKNHHTCAFFDSPGGKNKVISWSLSLFTPPPRNLGKKHTYLAVQLIPQCANVIFGPRCFKSSCKTTSLFRQPRQTPASVLLLQRFMWHFWPQKLTKTNVIWYMIYGIDWWIDGLIDACTRLHPDASLLDDKIRTFKRFCVKNETRIHPASSRVRCQGRKPPQPLQMSSDHILTRHLPQVASDRKPCIGATSGRSQLFGTFFSAGKSFLWFQVSPQDRLW